MTSDEPLTGEKLARLAAADFRKFFFPFCAPSITIRVEAVDHARARRKADDTCIVIPKEMAEEVIDGSDRLHFHLLILGHEIAHLVHMHLYGEKLDATDNSALEFWADFYGAKAMMSLITLGEAVPQRYRLLQSRDANFESKIESIGNAVARISRSYYVENKNYPPPLMRISLASNGVISFLRQYFIVKNVGIQWMFAVQRKILFHPSNKDLIILYADQINYTDPLKRARRWHLKMQKNNVSAYNLRPALRPYLSPIFDNSYLEMEWKRRKIYEELDELAAAINEPNMFKNDLARRSKPDIY